MERLADQVSTLGGNVRIAFAENLDVPSGISKSRIEHPAEECVC